MVLALVVASCSDSSEPASTPAATSTTSTVVETTTTTLAESTTTTTDAETTTTLAAGPLPPLLVTNADGVLLLDGDFMAQQPTGPASVAFDDADGNVYFQRPRDFTDPGSTIVYVLTTDSFESRELLVPTGEQYLELLDVEDGAVWYTRSEGYESPETARQTLRRYDIASGEVTEVAVTGGWESGIGTASVGAERIVTEWFAEGFSAFNFLDLVGERLTVPGDPYEGTQICEVGVERSDDQGNVLPGCFLSPSLSDDGRVAYVERDIASGETALVVRLVDPGDEVFRTEIDVGDGEIGPTEILGEWALMNRYTFEEEQVYGPALVFNLRTGEMREVGVAGFATFEHGNVPIGS